MRVRPGPTLVRCVLAGLVLAGCAGPPAVQPARQPAATQTSDAIALSAETGQLGKATWYGRRHHGRRTASGETFDRHGMTAAHPSLPFGTRLRVTNLANGASVVVRINDRCRCPSIMIDLSEAAARSIGLLGTGRVRMERL